MASVTHLLEARPKPFQTLGANHPIHPRDREPPAHPDTILSSATRYYMTNAGRSNHDDWSRMAVWARRWGEKVGETWSRLGAIHLTCTFAALVKVNGSNIGWVELVVQIDQHFVGEIWPWQCRVGGFVV